MGDELFEALEPSKDLLTAWRDGLGMNPAAPDDVLIALLHRGASFLWRPDLPSSVVDAALERRLLGSWAEYRDFTPSQWRAIIFGEADPDRRSRLLRAFVRLDLKAADWGLLVRDPDPRIRADTLWHPIPDECLASLTEDMDPRVRGCVCATSWSSLTDSQRAHLMADLDDTVRTEAERADLEARAQAQSRAPSQLARLAADPDPQVRFGTACRPELTDEQREAIDIDVDPGLHWPDLAWITALHDDPVAMRRLAASKVFLIRRSVARAKHLPPDVIERLANDPDRVVQLFLAESCDDAPADMLLRVAEWWTGSLSAPDVPRRHPNFPKRGLLRFADDPNPNLRRLALDDPDSTADLVERFIDDPDENVRYRATSDPRISARTAERLLSEPERRDTVAANPGLPPHLLMTLLHNEQTARNAARNPALSAELMRKMVRRIGRLPADS
ncbi:hypothetical protein ABH920_003442 [Catenulispora sp. EB89]|uniref:PE-PGRS family protein n=1 Tax=Catenulispora sp. EB89 TaxID=3156257 RepID=UPI003511745E